MPVLIIAGNGLTINFSYEFKTQNIMELQQLIEKWEREMDDHLNWIENEKDLTKRYIHISAHTAISDMLADVKQLNLPPVNNSLPVDFLQNEMIKAIKKLAKESTAPDKDTPDWLESDIKRGAKWMYARLTGNDC